MFIVMRLRSMFGYRPKLRKFDYQPRFYDPEEEERKKRRRNIRFKSVGSERAKRQNRSVLIYALFLSMVVFMMFRLEACTRF